MPFNPITNAEIKVGDAITKDLLDKIKSNFNDHEERLTTLAGGSGKIVLFNDVVMLDSYRENDLNGIAYFEVPQGCIVTEFGIRIFEKYPLVSGLLSVDLKKGSSTNNASFASVLSSVASVNFSTDADYAKKNALISDVNQSLTQGQLLKVDILSIPNGLKKFTIFAIGEY